MADTPLAKKLGMKSGQKALVLNAPEGYMQVLGEVPDGVEIRTTPGDGGYDFVQVFVHSKAELERYAETGLDSVKRNGLLWFCYPKKSSKIKSDLTRDINWESLTEEGWTVVSAVSVDETLSALRFRPAEDVRSRS